MWPVGGCCYDVCVARQSVVVVMTCVWPVSRWLLLRRVCGRSVVDVRSLDRLLCIRATFLLLPLNDLGQLADHYCHGF